MTFIKFSQQGKRDSKFISLTASKSFGFGGDFLRLNKLDDKNYVELYFDPDNKRIGFKFTAEKNDVNAFKLIKSNVSNSKSTVARSFFTTYLKDIDLTRFEPKYQPEIVNDPEQGTLFAIELKELTEMNK